MKRWEERDGEQVTLGHFKCCLKPLWKTVGQLENIGANQQPERGWAHPGEGAEVQLFTAAKVQTQPGHLPADR